MTRLGCLLLVVLLLDIVSTAEATVPWTVGYPAGFDRDAFHEVMNREIVAFFDRTLRPGGDQLTKSARPPFCR